MHQALYCRIHLFHNVISVYGLDIEIRLHLITIMDTFWTQANVLPGIMISCMSLNTADLYTGFL